MGSVRAIVPTPRGARLTVDARGWKYRAGRGDSVAVNGVCLTATQAAGRANVLVFDAVPETLAKTTIGALHAGDPVNLEHAATAGTLLGGHVVQGHVDGVATVTAVVNRGEWRVRLALPTELMPFMVSKGSVCLDGVSLTIAAVGRGWIDVALIPTTLDKTTLRGWKKGSPVNIEADIMAKTIVGWLTNWSGARARRKKTGRS